MKDIKYIKDMNDLHDTSDLEDLVYLPDLGAQQLRRWSVSPNSQLTC